MVCIAPGDQEGVLTHFARLALAATGVGQVAVGRPRQGAVGIGHSYEEALNALDVAQRMGLDDPLLRAADLLVFPVLARDRQALVDRCSTRSACTSTPAAWLPPRPGTCRSACAR